MFIKIFNPYIVVIILFLCTFIFLIFDNRKNKKSSSYNEKVKEYIYDDQYDYEDGDKESYTDIEEDDSPLIIKPGSFSINEVLDGIEQDDPRILKVIREKYLTPPTSRDVPYNFQRTQMNTKFGPDHSLDKTADKVFKILGGKISNGIFVESGANDGEQSNTVLMERDYNWTGVLIEPQPVSLKKLLSKNRKAWISNVCASPVGKPMKLRFNQISDYDVAGHLMLNRDENNLKKKGNFITVQCFPIFSVLAALNYTIVDYFSLDVESVEFEVLKTIPWDKIIFKVITVEIQFLHDETISIIKYMKFQGYVFITQVYFDYLFVHNSTDFIQQGKQL